MNLVVIFLTEIKTSLESNHLQRQPKNYKIVLNDER